MKPLKRTQGQLSDVNVIPPLGELRLHQLAPGFPTARLLETAAQIPDSQGDQQTYDR